MWVRQDQAQAWVWADFLIGAQFQGAIWYGRQVENGTPVEYGTQVEYGTGPVQTPVFPVMIKSDGTLQMTL